MKLTKKLEAEIKKFMKTYWDTYLKGDLKTWATFLPADYKNIGGTEEEIWNSKKEILDYTKRMINQMVGQMEIRNTKYQIFSYDPYIMVHEFTDMFVKVDNKWSLYGKFRLSSIIQKSAGGWKVLHQHGSFPDSKAAEGEAFSVDQLKSENIKLLKAVKERTAELEEKNRELEIETALEKVRAIALSMKVPDDMLVICKTISLQLQSLGVNDIRNVQTAIFYENRGSYMNYEYYAKHKKTFITETCYTDHKIASTFAKKMLKGKGEVSITILKEKKVKEWIAYQKTTNVFIDTYLYKASSLNYYWHSLGPVALGISTYTPLSKDDLSLFNRFLNVFELAYTRYLDIEKAEAQAREAEIELALERVRARGMSMHSSGELAELVATLFRELSKLDVGLDSCVIWNHDFEKQKDELWVASSKINKPAEPYFIQPFHKPFFKSIINAWKAKDKQWVYELKGKDKTNFQQAFFKEVPNLPKALKSVLKNNIKVFFSATFNQYGALEIISSDPLSENSFDLLHRFGKVFSSTYTRFLDLQKAEAQAKEAQIEAALEKVRSRSMAMQKSDELGEVILLLLKKLPDLGIDMENRATGIFTFEAGNKDYYQWAASPEYKTLISFLTPHFDHPIQNGILNARQNGIDFYAKSYPVLEKNSLFKYLFKLPALKDMPKADKEKALGFKYYDLAIALEKNSALAWVSHSGIPFTEAENAILRRFAKVFEQSYTRFLDLQKAEAQAREAQIEAALERTRTQSMIMQHSNELDSTSRVFHEQLLLLGIESEFSYLWLPDVEKDKHLFWATWHEEQNGSAILQSKSATYDLDRTEPYTAECFRAWGSGEPVHIYPVAPDRVKNFFDLWSEIMGNAKKLKPEFFSEGLYYDEAFMKYGCFGIVIRRLLTEDEKKILLRFTIEFERTYTRFLDLQKSEAQAREAQIEAALEKVRSRSLAMHKPEELQEVVAVVAEKLNELGVILDANGVIICTYFPDSKDVMHWMAAPDFSNSGSYLLPYFDHPIFNAAWESKISGDEYFSKSFTKEEKDSFFKYAFEHSDYKYFPDEFKDWIFQNDKHSLSFAWAKNSALLIPSHTGIIPSETEKEILKRFARVFEQAYIRFMDLKNAEALTHKSKIEVALERVRARALAMQQPEELKEVAEVLRTEMGLLGVEELETCSIYINDEQAEKAECWYALKDFRSEEKKLVNDHFALNLNDTWVGREMLQFYQTSAMQTSIVMSGNNRTEWIRMCEEKSAPFRGYYGEVIPDRTYHLYKFSHGAIGAASAGDISNESWELLRRAASVFSLAYSRFKDLTQARIDLEKLKTEKLRAEDALTNLKAAQSQLVQSEKMASLGELTAGIAHEIQNPLNFVNNFSEVSKELLDEMRDAIEKGDAEEAKEIMNDVIQNLEKINHHGKRADGIVKGMLQHSRSSSGTKEPTDINALADEYLRLAYHGLRAKDKSFNATMKTDFDETIGSINIIPQDMGRVILNLITNAFYEVDKKKKQVGADYNPTVSVSTKKENGNVMIQVRDNANGIPQKVLDKIFQPFFTTKPTGQGTGLGLSLAYDIIKAHGGEIKVETKENEGTAFILQLPTG